MVQSRKSVYAVQEDWDNQKGDNIQSNAVTLSSLDLCQTSTYVMHTFKKTGAFSLFSHIPISGCQAQVPLNEHWAKTYVKLKTHTWLCPVNDRWRLEQLQFIHNALCCGSFTEVEALLSAIWKQGTTTKQLYFGISKMKCLYF